MKVIYITAHVLSKLVGHLAYSAKFMKTEVFAPPPLGLTGSRRISPQHVINLVVVTESKDSVMSTSLFPPVVLSENVVVHHTCFSELMNFNQLF